jgi:hypothetical protein
MVHFFQLTELVQEVWHRCRNLRCRSKLPAPVLTAVFGRLPKVRQPSKFAHNVRSLMRNLSVLISA